MNTPSLKSWLCALVIVTFAGHSRAALLVTNGDFSNLSGLTALGGGWYGGVPAGWTGMTADYSVFDTGTNFVANLNTLTQTSPVFTPLEQNIGTIDSTGDVVLSFELLQAFNEFPIDTGVAIYNAVSGDVLINGNFNTAGLHTLTAPNVAAGTSIRIAFWNLGATPGLDNVTAVPEPGTWAMLLVGGVMLVFSVRRQVQRKG